MKRDRSLGVVLGLLLVAVTISDNVARRDRGLLTAPGVLPLVLIPGFLYFALRSYARREANRDSVRRFGQRVVIIAAAIFAPLLAIFSLFWFRHLHWIGQAWAS